MNHRFEINNWLPINWELIIILNNKPNLEVSYTLCYSEGNYYAFIYNKNSTRYKHNYGPEIIQYLVSNNICTIYKTYDNGTNLVLNPHILLELI